MTFADNLKSIREHKGLKQKDVATILGCSVQSYSQYENGKRQPKLETVQRFAQALNVPISALLLPTMEKDEDYVSAPWFEDISDDDLVNLFIAPGRTQFSGKDLSNIASSHEKSDNKGKDEHLPAGAIPVRPGPMIPVLGEVRCGLPMYAEENIVGYESFAGKSGEQYFALYAVGDSMNAAGINEGDTVIVQKQDVVEPNQIAVVCVNGDEATLKRFRQENNLVFLSPQSYNPVHQIQVYDLKKTPVHIMGRVVQVRHNFQ